MSTCRCCGQHIEVVAETSNKAADETKVIRVDDKVLALCNLAYEDAVVRQSRHVEIAHLALALLRAGDGAAALRASGVLAVDLSRSAEAWLQEWQQRAEKGDVVRTSGEMKALLRHAQGLATREGRAYATPEDVVRALLSNADELWSASFAIRQSSAFAPRPSERREPSAQPARYDGRFAHSSLSAAVMPASATTGTSVERDYAWLLARGRSSDSGLARPPSAPGNSGRETATTDALPARQAFLSSDASKPAAYRSDDHGEQASLMRALLARLDSQERSFGQRFDTQQRMLADLAEAFARSLRDAASLRETVSRLSFTGGSEHASGVATQSSSGSSSSQTSRGSRSGSAGRSDSRWRRQSWSQWRRNRRGSRRSFVSQDRNPWQAAPVVQLEDPEAAFTAPAGVADLVAVEAENAGGREKRFYLALDDDIEKAPSIGPRTAGQLRSAGIMTVRDLLACDTAATAAKMAVRYITAERLLQWQAQSRLVCTIPWLRGTHAQLLAGAGFDTIDKIVAADTASVCAAILKFASTRDGQSVLRNAPPPGMDWVALRLEHARAAEPQRAAA